MKGCQWSQKNLEKGQGADLLWRPMPMQGCPKEGLAIAAQTNEPQWPSLASLPAFAEIPKFSSQFFRN